MAPVVQVAVKTENHYGINARKKEKCTVRILSKQPFERVEELLAKYPKFRKPLPDAYQKIYEEHYMNNRNGQTVASFFSSKLEQWMHRKVAADTYENNRLSTLEIGAGTLNQLNYESTEVYDIVEPFRNLYRTSKFIGRVRNIYADISEVERTAQYDRIIAIASFEHICNLPEVVEYCRDLLKPNGCLRIAIPNEGRFLWRLSYKATTGLEFSRKYKLDYSVLMNYEHVNTADEIEAILRYYFSDVKMSLLGISKDFAFYRYYECTKL